MKSRLLTREGDQMKNTYIILTGKSEDERFLERSGYRSENNTKAYFK
jgi:hypothetical protein